MRLIAKGLKQATRLDKFLRTQNPRWGRQAVQQTISAGRVKINGRKVWLASWKVNNGDRLEIAIPPAEKSPPVSRFNPAWIIAQAEDLIAVNKPAGLLSQATRWGNTANLLDLATAHFGPVALFHRLDRDTSGVVLFTRPGPVNQYLDRAFKSRTVIKEYLAVVKSPNQLTAEGIINARLAPQTKRRDKMQVVTRGGKSAVTRYQIEAEGEGWQKVRLWPQTGRTHQLRVHLQFMQAPILGDRLYNPEHQAHNRLMLHACQITLPQMDDFARRVFSAPLPDVFQMKKE